MAESRLHDRFRPGKTFESIPAFKGCSEATLQRLKDEALLAPARRAWSSKAIVPNRVA